jgi:hypothetical protein
MAISGKLKYRFGCRRFEPDHVTPLGGCGLDLGEVAAIVRLEPRGRRDED